MNTTFLHLNGMKHHLYQWGHPTNPPLLLLHGYKDIGFTFARITPHLEQDFFCIAPDFRGFGKSEHTSDPLGYVFYDYVADVHQLAEHYSPDQPLPIVGHSMGGQVASLYAGTFPERVSHLVNLDGFILADQPASHGPGKLRKWIEGNKKVKNRTYSQLEEVVARLKKNFPYLDDPFLTEYAKHSTESSPEGIRFTFDEKHNRPHPYLFQLETAAAFWKKIQAKCLLVGCENILPGSATLEERKGYFPKDTQTLIFSETGHAIQLERPQETADAILRFIKESPTATAT